MKKYRLSQFRILHSAFCIPGFGFGYTVKRKILGCTSVSGNPVALDCKLEP